MGKRARRVRHAARLRRRGRRRRGALLLPHAQGATATSTSTSSWRSSSTTDNPVFYVQYAHARIAERAPPGGGAGIVPRVDAAGRSTRSASPEVERGARARARGPRSSRRRRASSSRTASSSTAQELAAAFHRYYNQHRIITEDAALTQTRLALVAVHPAGAPRARSSWPASRRPSGCEGRHDGGDRDTCRALGSAGSCFLAWTVTCGLVYLLGIYVGKGIAGAAARHGGARRPAAGHRAPPPAGQRPKSDLTFYDKLAKQRGRAPRSPTPDPRRPRRRRRDAAAARRSHARVRRRRRRRPRWPRRGRRRRCRRRRAPRRRRRCRPRHAAAPPPRSAPTAAPPSRPRPRAARDPRRAAARVGPGDVDGAGEPDAQPREPTRCCAASAAAATTRVVEVARDGDDLVPRAGRPLRDAGQATEAMQRLRDQEGVSHVFVASE